MRYAIFIFLLLCLVLNSPAENRVPNSGFELGPSRGWLSWENLNKPTFNGNGSLYTFMNTNANSGGYSFRSTGRLRSRLFWLTNGNYVLTFSAKATSAHTHKAGILNETAGVTTVDPTDTISVTTSWARYTNTFTATSDGLYFVKFIDVNASVFYVDDVQVESGVTAHDYAPSTPVELGITIPQTNSMFFVGQTAQFTLNFWNTGPPTNATARYDVYDFWNSNVLSGVTSVALAAATNTTTNINIPNLTGWFRVMTRLADYPDSWDEATLVAYPFASNITYNAATDWLGGHPQDSTNNINREMMAGRHIGRTLGPGWQANRWGFVSGIEYNQGVFDWNDYAITNLTQQGMYVVATLTPEDGTWPHYFTNSEAVNLGLWSNYCYKLVYRYNVELGLSNSIIYEVGPNEPLQSGPTTPINVRDAVTYANVLTYGVWGATNAHGSAKLIGIAGAAGAGEWAWWVYTNLPAGTKAALTAVSTHVYPQDSVGVALNPNGSFNAVSFVNNSYGYATNFAGIKPVWNTESGVGTVSGFKGQNTMWTNYYSLFKTDYTYESQRMERQSRSLTAVITSTEEALRGLGAGLDKFLYYDCRRFNDASFQTAQPYGQDYMQVDHPHLVSLSIAQYMVTHGFGRVVNSGETKVEAYSFTNSSGNAVIAAWNYDRTNRTATLTNAFFAAYDVMGNRISTNSANIALDRFPTYFVSSTLSLVQMSNMFCTATFVNVADTIPPQVSFSVAPTGAWNGDSAGTLVKWDALDNRWSNYPEGYDYTNILSKYSLDGAAYTTYSQSNYVWLSGLSAGNHTIKVTVKDKNNNADEWTYDFLAGEDIPVITITSPTNNQPSVATSITVTGTSSDNDTVSGVSLTNISTGVGATVTGTTSWSATMTLRQGTNTLQAVVTDNLSNKATNSIDVIAVNLTNRNTAVKSPYLGVQYLQIQNPAAQHTLMSNVPATYVNMPITYAILTGGAYGGHANGTNYYDATYAANTNAGWNIILQFSDMPTNLIATYVPYLVARYPSWMVIPLNENDSAAESSAIIKLFRTALPTQRLGGPALYHIVNPPYIDALIASNAFQLLDSFVAHDYLAVPLNGLCTAGWWTNSYYHPSNTPTGYHPEWSVGNLPSRLTWMNSYTNQLRTDYTDTPKAIVSEYGIYQNDVPDGEYAGRIFRSMHIPVFVTANFATTNQCPYNNALYDGVGVGYFTESQQEFLSSVEITSSCAVASPVVVASGGAGLYSTSSSTINVSGTSDNPDAVISWSNSRGGAGSATGNLTWSKTGITLYSGGNTLTFTATSGEDSTSTTLTVTYTPPPPGGSTNNVWILNLYNH